MKLLAGFFNALGIGLIGFALLRPLVEGNLDIAAFPYAFLAAGLVFHGIAHYLLGYLKKDEPDDH